MCIRDRSNINLKLILSQLNSKILTYFALKENYIQMRAGSVPQIRLKEVKLLPIIIPEIKIEEKLIYLVNKILNCQENNDKENIVIFKNEIDFILYKLYGLTEEEIEIIENRK